MLSWVTYFWMLKSFELALTHWPRTNKDLKVGLVLWKHRFKTPAAWKFVASCNIKMGQSAACYFVKLRAIGQNIKPTLNTLAEPCSEPLFLRSLCVTYSKLFSIQKKKFLEVHSMLGPNWPSNFVIHCISVWNCLSSNL